MTDYFEITDRDGTARIGELRLAEPVVTPALVAPEARAAVEADGGTGADRDPEERGGDQWIGDRRAEGTDPATLAGSVGGHDPVRPERHPDEAAILRDAGSLWPAERPVPEGDDRVVTMLPHRAFPAGTERPVIEAFTPSIPAIDGPSAAVVTSDAPDVGRAGGTTSETGTGTADVGGGPSTEEPAARREPSEPSDVGDDPSIGGGTPDVYVLSDAQGMVGHASRFVDSLVRTRRALPPDTALYLSGVATPRNVATLVYAGVDLVDATRARIAVSQGHYLTTDDDRFLADLDQLPCACPACREGRESFDRADCARHNVHVLAAQLRRVRQRIREGRLRDYLEGQARQNQWLTAAMRELDDEYAYVEARTPVVRREVIDAASADTLRRVEIQRFAERVTNRYRCRFDAPLVLVPCSARKPYSESQSHAQFHRAIAYRGHTVSMTSPIGVVPQELELTYPAQQYDSVVTGRWTETETQFVTRVLAAYLERTDYPRVIAHVPPDGYREICERVADRVDVPFEYTVADHPTTDESLAALRDALDGEPTYDKRTRQHNTVRAIADYMLGQSAGDAVFDEIRTTGRYPKLQVCDTDGEQLATMVPEYGVLSFTLAGARRWAASDAPTKRVTIDGFVPRGSVLAPGVVDADDDIRVGDEVLVEGPQAFGVGRARMFGREMREATRGVAVQTRHVEEL